MFIRYGMVFVQTFKCLALYANQGFEKREIYLLFMDNLKRLTKCSIEQAGANKS